MCVCVCVCGGGNRHILFITPRCWIVWCEIEPSPGFARVVRDKNRFVECTGIVLVQLCWLRLLEVFFADSRFFACPIAGRTTMAGY